MQRVPMEGRGLGQLGTGAVVVEMLRLEGWSLLCEGMGVWGMGGTTAGQHGILSLEPGGGGMPQCVPQVPVPQALQGQRLVQAASGLLRRAAGERQRPAGWGGAGLLGRVGVWGHGAGSGVGGVRVGGEQQGLLVLRLQWHEGTT